MKFSRVTQTIASLSIVVMILASCNFATGDGGVDQNDSLAAVTSTVIPETQASAIASPEKSEPGRVPTSTSEGAQASPPTLVIGTPRNEEPIQKEAPSGPAPSQPTTTTADSQFDSDGDGFYTYNDLKQAVEALLPSYDFPQNYQVTSELLLSGFADYKQGGGQWEVQYEYTLIGLRYLCAWGHTWLDAYRDGNTGLMDESLDHFADELQDNPVFNSYRDDIAPFIDKARLGDPSGLQQYIDSSCGSMNWTSTPPPAPTSWISMESLLS